MARRHVATQTKLGKKWFAFVKKPMRYWEKKVGTTFYFHLVFMNNYHLSFANIRYTLSLAGKWLIKMNTTKPPWPLPLTSSPSITTTTVKRNLNKIVQKPLATIKHIISSSPSTFTFLVKHCSHTTFNANPNNKLKLNLYLSPISLSQLSSTTQTTTTTQTEHCSNLTILFNHLGIPLKHHDTFLLPWKTVFAHNTINTTSFFNHLVPPQ